MSLACSILNVPTNSLPACKHALLCRLYSLGMSCRERERAERKKLLHACVRDVLAWGVILYAKRVLLPVLQRKKKGKEEEGRRKEREEGKVFSRGFSDPS